MTEPRGCVRRFPARYIAPAETLDTYSHLWPDSDDRTREAVDHVLGNPAEYILSTLTNP